VIREAIRKEGMVAIGKVVFTSREHIIALEARGKGLLGVTLRRPNLTRALTLLGVASSDHRPRPLGVALRRRLSAEPLRVCAGH
jgi:DNA end-binding protein Ku